MCVCVCALATLGLLSYWEALRAPLEPTQSLWPRLHYISALCLSLSLSLSALFLSRLLSIRFQRGNWVHFCNVSSLVCARTWRWHIAFRCESGWQQWWLWCRPDTPQTHNPEWSHISNRNVKKMWVSERMKCWVECCDDVRNYVRWERFQNGHLPFKRSNASAHVIWTSGSLYIALFYIQVLQICQQCKGLFYPCTEFNQYVKFWDEKRIQASNRI